MNYLSSEEVLYIHYRLVDEIGGKHGTADIKLLNKAIKYIHNSEVFPDKFTKAAAIFFAVSKKKPFVENNLITALTATKLFLEINKVDFQATEPEVLHFIKKELSKAKIEDIKEILEQNSSPISA